MRRVRILTAVGALAAAASIAPNASAAAQRYASPTGTGTDCSSAIPCSLRQAVEHAGGFDEVIVAPGDYTLTTKLETPYPMTIHGVAGQPRPRVLFSGPGQNQLRVIAGSTLCYVEVEQAPGNQWPVLYAKQATVDQVIAKGSGHAAFTAEINNSMIRNSIVVASGDLGVAVQTDANGADNAGTYRNVTAIATGSDGVAIRAWAYDGHVNVLARNVIARGGPGGHSIVARAINPGTIATITVSHTNRLDESTDGAGASIADGGGNQSSAPVFVNAAAGDYRQAEGSPTIDAGLAEIVSGAFDVDGDPRQIGGIDIGADEFVAVPAVTTGAATAVTADSATLGGSVDANWAPTTYRFEYGPTTAYGSVTATTDAGSGGAVAATAALAGLSPSTTYHYRLVATNSGGVSTGADKTFTTAAPPPAPIPPSPIASSTTETSTTQVSSTQTTATAPFAGVKLVSSRLSFGRRFIALKLSCPGGTVGRCSGRTKLTAKRVTLGRATFSIAPGAHAKVTARVTRAGRKLLRAVPRLRGRAGIAAHDGAGQSKTTRVAVTIRHR
jgi:hypothetical protein